MFKLQIKLTPVSEGGLLPTTLNDLTTLCRATPLAPICSPAGDAIDQLCSLLGALPLCDKSAVDGVSAALAQAEKGGVPGTTSPLIPQPTTDPGAAGGGTAGGSSGGTGGLLVQLLGGLLGGGAR